MKQIVIVVLCVVFVFAIIKGVIILFGYMSEVSQQTTITSTSDQQISESSTSNAQRYEYYIRKTPVVGVEEYFKAMKTKLPDGYEVVNYTEFNRWGDFYAKIRIEESHISELVRQLKNFGAQENEIPVKGHNYEKIIDWWDADLEKITLHYGRAILRTDDGFIYEPMGTYPEGYGLVLMIIFFLKDDDGTCYMYIRSQ